MSCAGIRHACKMAQRSSVTKGQTLYQGYILFKEKGKIKCECLNYISCADTVDHHAEVELSSMPSYLNSPAFTVLF